MVDVIVATADLRSALAATVVHLWPDADYSRLHRIRVVVDEQVLTLTATTGHTAAMTTVGVVEHGDGELGSFDLSRADVRKLLAVFKGGKRKDDTDAELLVRLHVEAEHLVITDVGGLFDGEQLSLIRYPTDEKFPDIAQLIADTVHRTSTRGAAPQTIRTTGAHLSAFSVAGRIYARPVLISAGGGRSPALVECGDSFIGVLVSAVARDGAEEDEHDWRVGWRARLPEPRAWRDAAAAAVSFTTLAAEFSEKHSRDGVTVTIERAGDHGARDADRAPTSGADLLRNGSGVFTAADARALVDKQDDDAEEAP